MYTNITSQFSYSNSNSLNIDIVSGLWRPNIFIVRHSCTLQFASRTYPVSTHCWPLHRNSLLLLCISLKAQEFIVKSWLMLSGWNECKLSCSMGFVLSGISQKAGRGQQAVCSSLQLDPICAESVCIMKFAFHGLLFCTLCTANDLLAQRDTFIKEMLCLQSVNTNAHCVLCVYV